MGYKIRERRLQKNMTQEELAAKSGVSRMTIVAIESERGRQTTTGTLVKLANALECEVADIFFNN